MTDRPHLFHKLAERWQPIFKGYRTILVLLLGYPIACLLTWRVYQTDDEFLAGVMMWMAGIYTVLLLAYPISKGMTGLRERWTHGANRHPAQDHIPPPTEPEPPP